MLHALKIGAEVFFGILVAAGALGLAGALLVMVLIALDQANGKNPFQ